MLQRIKQFYKLSKYTGISYRQENDQDIFRCCTVELDKDKLEILDTTTSLDWEEFATRKDKQWPVALHLESRQILFKEYMGQVVDEETIKSIFPSYDADRFYVQQLQGTDRTWLAFVRKDYIANLLERFKEAGYLITTLFVGPFVLDNILGQLNSYEHRYIIDRHRIEIDATQAKWQHYDYNDAHASQFVVKVGDQPIKQEYVLAYASAFSALMDTYVEDYSVDVPSVKKTLETVQEKKKFKTNALFFVGLFFALLLINTLLFSHYYQDNEDLSNRVNTQQSTVKDLGKIEEDIKLNENLITQLGWNGGVSKAWLLDQIGISIRNFNSINLEQIQINPQQKGLGNTLIQQPQFILIKGSCPSLNILNEWIREIKNNTWIMKVNIEEYGNKQVGETNDAFTLKIEYNDQVEGN
ncbi:hypothetical protein LZQ00_10080 [Sphingobacterium sp. SRCM116780]|uniref:hypothetical protein n=1 Tax=Sphingobacterium sp. SRCM116780 TaxID=2907623 RepID=UPI001F251B96|nr:hypothetical protein [Sphingobacterium sp. SRCM116780]UIR54622.1 hypothetical protein LZQ00_10080 [Sphingobacterium sp. SRCM116780]